MPQPLPDDIKAAEAYAADMPVDKDGWIVLDRTTINQIAKDKQRIAELEQLSISLFEALKSAHEALTFLQGNSALSAALEAATANLEAEVTRILGRPVIQQKAGV